MYLIIDNYDSFVHNLARYFVRAGRDVAVHRNDSLTLRDIETLTPAAIILSPGPCTPHEAGICMDVIKHFGSTIPILGVCLGHQAIGEVYGAPARITKRLAHGKDEDITHHGEGLFAGLASPMTVGRYHSLIIEPDEHSPLRVTAKSADGMVMAVQHNAYPVFGVQFHPESILTPQGADIVYNFTQIVEAFHNQGEIAA